MDAGTRDGQTGGQGHSGPALGGSSWALAPASPLPPRVTPPQTSPAGLPPCLRAEFPRQGPAAGVGAPHQPEHHTMSQTPRSMRRRRGVLIPAPGRFMASLAQDGTGVWEMLGCCGILTASVLLQAGPG